MYKPLTILLTTVDDVWVVVVMHSSTSFTDVSGHFTPFALSFHFLGKPCHECREIHIILLILVDCIVYLGLPRPHLEGLI